MPRVGYSTSRATRLVALLRAREVLYEGLVREIRTLCASTGKLLKFHKKIILGITRKLDLGKYKDSSNFSELLSKVFENYIREITFDMTCSLFHAHSLCFSEFLMTILS